MSSKKITRLSKTPSDASEEVSKSSSKPYYSVIPQATESSKVTKFGDADEESGSSTAPRKRNTRTSASASVQNAYIVQGHNGAALVDMAMENLGWQKLTDKNAENWKLRWTETKGMINFSHIKEGEQLVNHIPNCELMCNKLGLLTSLREYERVTLSVKNRPPKMLMSDFVPETYILDDKRERDMFFEAWKSGDIWINKPTGLNQGKGIFLIRDLDKFKAELHEKEEADKNATSVKSRRSMGRIVQRYIMNPLLIKERKYDIRAYMLISSTTPLLVLFHHGYIRLSIHKYTPDDANLCTHLTNQFIQKKDSHYEDVKDDTVWSMEQFNEYMNSLIGSDGGPLEKDWVFNDMERQMKAILAHLISAVRHKLSTKLGFFELYGIDFMLDTDFKMYLLEVNTNPAMHINCQLLKDILPPLIEKTIHISLECFEKSRRRQQLFPLKSLSTFSVICSGNSNNNGLRSQRGASPQTYRFGNVQPRYRLNSSSPTRTQSIDDQSQKAAVKPQLNTNLNPAISASLPHYQPPQPVLRRSPTLPSFSSGKGNNVRRFEESLRRYDPIAWDGTRSSARELPLRNSGDKSLEPALTSGKASSEKPSVREKPADLQSANCDSVQLVGQTKNITHSLTSVTSDSLWKPNVASSTTCDAPVPDEGPTHTQKLSNTNDDVTDSESVLLRKDFRRIKTSIKREVAPISTVRVVSSSSDSVRLKMSHQQMSDKAAKIRSRRRNLLDRSG